MQEGLTDLFTTGPPGESLKFAHKLEAVRLSFRAWVTEDIGVKLMPFENALRKMGTTKIVLEGIPPGEKRSQLVSEIFKIFSDVAGIEYGGPADEKLAAGRIMNHLQDLLEVRQLSQLRRAVVQAVIDSLERKA